LRHRLRYFLLVLVLHICTIANGQLPMPDSLCVGATKKYSVNDATVPSTYTWKINGITQPATVHEIFVTWNTIGVYTISVQEENANGCKGQIEQGVVYVFPIPLANAGPDAIYCFESTPRLNGSGGTKYEWSPATYLSNATIANPFVNTGNAGTYTYNLSVTNAAGCKSTITDAVTITILPKARIFAGADTSIAINQPLQLNAVDIDNLGFVNYTWTASFGLDDATKPNPIAIIDKDRTYTVIGTTTNGCKATDNVNIKVFNKADIYVPTAFTPNGDGNNDLLRPILVGIRELKYFSVYNRYGELIYKTSTSRAGWDGTIKGAMQNTGSFVWIAEGVDYKGTVLVRKGMCTLVR
jgi:gliding motility-associated-like protein